MSSSSIVNPSEDSDLYISDESASLTSQEFFTLFNSSGAGVPGADFNAEERERATQANRNTNPGDRTPSTFEEFQAAGSLRQKWVEDPSVPCPILHSNLTAQDLLNQGWSIQDRQPWLSYFDIEEIRGLDVPQDHSDPTGRLEDFNYRFEEMYAQFGDAKWIGYTGPGVLVMSDIERAPDSATPPIAEVAKVVYERTFDINSLKYVFFQNIVNRQTQAFIHQILYTNERLGYTWSDRPGDHRVWDRNSPEYQALLGTRIGKIVLYVILASYPRGTRRIARVVTYRIPDEGTIHMRFDIENIEATQGPQTLRRSSRQRKCPRCLGYACGGCYIL